MMMRSYHFNIKAVVLILLLTSLQLWGVSHTAVAQVSVSPGQLEETLGNDESSEVAFTLLNEGSDAVEFSFPQFITSARGDLSRAFRHQAEATQQQAFAHEAITQYRRAVEENRLSETSFSPGVRSVIEAYESGRQDAAANEAAGLFGAPGYDIVLESVALPALNFVLYDEQPVSGTLESFVAAFELEEAQGPAAWSDDLAIVFTNSPEFDLNDIILQIGGFSPQGQEAVFLPWFTGGPAQPVDESQTLQVPIELNEAYVWVGNTFPAEGTWSGEISLQGISESPSFITGISETSGSIAAGGSVELSAMFSSAGLETGTYTADLLLEKTAGETSMSMIPALLNVVPQPGIALSDESVEFGEVPEGTTATFDLGVINTGNAALTLSSFTSNNDVFSVESGEAGALEIPAFSAMDVPISFSPDSPGTETGSLSFETNAAGAETLSLSLSGTGLSAPDIALMPESAAVELQDGETAAFSFEISNPGSGILNYTIPRFSGGLRPESGPRLSMDAITLSPGLQERNDRARELRRLEAFSQTQGEIAPEMQERISTLQQQLEASGITPVGAQRGEVNTASAAGGYPVIMDPLTLPGGSFTLVSEAVSGTLTSVEADFSLVEGASNASDLAILIIETNDTGIISPEDVRFQIGGPSFITTPNYIPWEQGDSNAPGTSISGSYVPEMQETYEDVYIWVSNTVVNGADSSWEGSITLSGLGEDGSLITAASPAAGSIDGGGSETITLEITAEGLVEGSYVDVLNILSNAPGSGTTAFTLEAMVMGQPGIELGSESLEFGDVFVNVPETRTLEIMNTGTAALEISGISTDNAAFTVDAEELTIAPFSNAQIEVAVSAAQEGALSATLGFDTNAAGSEQLSVPLNADVVETPAAALDPDNIIVQADAGGLATAEVTLSNSGSGPLSYSIPRFNEALRDAGGARLSGQPAELLTRRFVPEQDAGALRQRLMASAFLNGELEGETAEEAAGYLEAFEQSAHDALRPMDVGSGPSDDGFLIEMDGFTAAGSEFTLTGENLSGELSGIRGEFTLDGASGQTWTSDLAVLITTSTELDAHGLPVDILAQIGGFNNYGADFHISWQGGQHEMPVDNLLELDAPIELEDIYVWAGNGWSGGSGTWSGEVELFGLGTTDSLIVSAAPSSGVVQPGEAATLGLGLSAEELAGGVYNDALLILTNDPVSPELELFVTLNVDGAPEVALGAEELDFGTVFTGTTGQRGLEISNTGTGQLGLSQIQAEGEGFSAEDADLSLAPGQSALIAVSFAADQPGSFEGSLSISTNAEGDDATISIPLLAEAVNPGELVAGAESLSFDVPLGGTAGDVLNIANVGESALSFNIQTVQLSGPGSAAGRQAAAASRMEQAVDGLKNARSYVMPPMASAAPAGNVLREAGAGASARGQKSAETEILWEQVADGFNALVNTRIESLDSGIYSSDRFALENSSRISRIASSGFLQFEDVGTQALAASIFIYEDDNGRPAGHPDDQAGSEVFSGIFPVDEGAVSINPIDADHPGFHEITVDMEAAGLDVSLAAGDYWIVKSVVLSNDTHLWYQAHSPQGTDEVHLIDPEDYFELGITSWTNIIDIGIIESGLAFRIEGSGSNFLSATPVQGSLAAGESTQLDVAVDAAGLPPGQYTAELRISTDSPATPEVIVPVNLTVGDGEDTGLRWVNLDDPESITINEGEHFHIHGMAAGDEVMQPDGSVHEDLRMWVGFHTQDVHPGEWEEEVWTEGSFYQMHEEEEMAEFMAESGAHLPAGEYFYATRFQFGDHAMAYGGFHSEGGGFWSEGLNVSGQLTILPATSAGEEGSGLPEELALNQNYPNPFNPTTQIGYALPESADVRLEVYNMLGQRVAVLVSGRQSAGQYSVNFDASNLSSGFYIYRLVAGSQVRTRKMMLVK